MAFFEDLSRYDYDDSGIRGRTLNVGWLDPEKRFRKGTVSKASLKRLWAFCKIPAMQMRGFHVCEFCKMPRGVVPALEFDGETLKFGSAEVRIFGAGVIYASPNLIFHYVRDHHYKPPKEFLDALMSGPDPEGSDYRNRLRELGWL